MAEEKSPTHSEVFFLPPLKMVLAFFDSEINVHTQIAGHGQKEEDEKMVTKLIEKLSKKELKD